MNQYNPFKPGQIVHPGMFCGRVEEVIALERTLLQTKNGNPTHFLINGERGIGKSSLLLYLKTIAKGGIDSKYNFLTLDIDLGPSDCFTDIVKKVGSELQRTLITEQKMKEFLKSGWEFLTRWEVMGVRYKSANDGTLEPHELLEELAFTFEQTCQNLLKTYDGILILVDEADRPDVSANLGEFVKHFTERLTKRGCSNVCLGLAGLPAVMNKLRQSHPSAPRIFETVSLEPLHLNERKEIIQKGGSSGFRVQENTPYY